MRSTASAHIGCIVLTLGSHEQQWSWLEDLHKRATNCSVIVADCACNETNECPVPRSIASRNATGAMPSWSPSDTASAGILFDIAQVEVLRGPQGTRFGANGHAGMVFMHSNAPTDEFEAELSGGGNYDSYNLELVSCPLSSQSSGRLKIEGQDDTFFGYYHDGGLDSCKLINASLRWQSVTLWGRNLGDEDYAVHELYFGNESRDDFALSRTRLTCSPVSLSFMVLNYCIPSEVLMV